MNRIKVFAALVCVMVISSAFTFKDGNKKSDAVYAFGLSASFSDSLVFITDIMPIEGAKIDKSGFLVGRSQYAYQLKNYLEEKRGAHDATCVIFFSKKKKNLEKQSNKMLMKYGADYNSVINTVDGTDFHFTKLDEDSNQE